MDKTLIFDKAKIRTELEPFISYAQTLKEPTDLAKAIQAWDTVLSVGTTTTVLAQANFYLSKIYREWGELFTAKRFFGKAHQLEPANPTIRSESEALNRHIAENQAEIFEERDRKNSDLIVSLFRISTGLKLLQMDKPVQAYPLMKSRTKIYPNAAVAKHLLSDIIIIEDEKNTAISFLEAGDWLVNTQHELYSITNSGLYAFYTELAKLHIANEVYDEAAACYEQAYWLDASSPDPLYHKIICDAKSQMWEVGLTLLDWLPAELPEGIEPVEYDSAVATICGLAYQSTQDKMMGVRAVAACKTVLMTDKKNKEISNLLKSLRLERSLQSDLLPSPPKKSWWHW